jgi:ribosomal protein S18 acetylase RimI-like enzyme
VIVREARDGELEAVLALLAEDVIRERPEPEAVTDRQRAAFVELLADPGELLLVGEVDGSLVATAQVSWLRHLIYDGGWSASWSRSAWHRRSEGVAWGADGPARRRPRARPRLCTGAAEHHAARTDARRFYRRLGFVESHIGMKHHLENT